MNEDVERDETQELTLEVLFKMDMGKTPDDVYTFLGTTSIELNEIPIKDPSYYIAKITEVRRKITEVNKHYTDLLQAKTRAQSRLTTNETRYEIMMNAKLGEDPSVKTGQNIGDRMARAANTMVTLKRQIRECKNEVEAIKNLDKALNMVLRNLNALSGDLKQQAKLVEVELTHFKGHDNPTNNELVDPFAQEMARLEQQFLVASVVTEDETTEEEEAEEEEIVEEVSPTTEELPVVDDPQVAEENTHVQESSPAASHVQEVEEFSGFSIPDEDPAEEAPEEIPSSFELPESPPEIDDPEVTTPLPVAAPPEEMYVPSDDTEEDAVEDTLIFGTAQTTVSSNSIELDIPDTEISISDLSGLGLDTVPEGSFAIPVEAAVQSVAPQVVRAPSIASDSFSVTSVTVSEPKVSKHFAESLKETPTGVKKPEAVKVKEPETAKPKPATEVTIDDVLSEFGLG